VRILLALLQVRETTRSYEGPGLLGKGEVSVCPGCLHSVHTVVPVKLPAWEGSDVGAMREDGW
jgi:hypothetical protein